MHFKKHLSVLASILLVFCTISAQQAGMAIEQLHSLRVKLHDSRVANDWRSNLATANQLKTFLHDSPNSLLEVARAAVHVGDIDAAFRELEQFTRMGQSTDLVATSQDFAVLQKNANFAKLQIALKENERPISGGTTAFQLSDSNLLAEDIDYDSDGRRFFITSVREKKILAVTASGTDAVFATAPDNWPMLAVKVDRARHRLWATEVAMQDFDLAPKSDWGRSAVLCYDLKNGKLLRRVEGTRGSALGDMTLMANGDVILSDGTGAGIYRLPSTGEKLERLDNGDFISPQTPAMHPDGKHIFVPDYLRGIGVLDLATKQVHWLSTQQKFALNGIDGLYFDQGKLIAVQNGTSPERVVAFTLDPSLTKIESETIIEQSTDTLGDPTHGVVIGDNFFYIANSGWDGTDDRGNLKPNAKSSSPRVMKSNPLNTSSRSPTGASKKN